jgi:hypothetical protein
MKEMAGQVARFQELAKADLRKAFHALRAFYSGERFYVLGLCAPPLLEYIAPVGNSEESLADEEARWNPGDWACHLPDLDVLRASTGFLQQFQPLILEDDNDQFDVLGALKDCLFATLAELRDEGVFDAFGNRSSLLLNVVTPDDTPDSWLADAKRLNGPKVWGRMEAHFRQFGLI